MQTHDTSGWNAHYSSKVGHTYPAYCRGQYQLFLDILRGYMRNTTGRPYVLVREEGCGIGTITKILAEDFHESKKLYSLSAFDYDTAQVANTRKNIHPRYNVDIYEGNHFENQGQCNIIHAHGVLEHFSDEEIMTVLKRQRAEADVVIHYVPLEGWGEGSYGDERLLSLAHWKFFHEPTHAFTFNDGKDAVLIWEK